MRFLLLFAALLTFAACGDTSTASSSTASVAGTGSTANSTIDPGALADRRLESPDIRISIPGVPLPGALLIGQVGEQQYRAGEFTVDGNGIVFKQAEPLKTGHYYAYFSDGAAVQLLIDQDQTMRLSAPNAATAVTTMTVKGNEDTRRLYESLAFEAGQQEEFRAVGEAIRTTAPGTDAYNELQSQRNALIDVREAFQDRLFAQAPDALFTSYKRAGRNPRLIDARNADGSLDEKAQVAAFRADFWDGVDFNDVRLLNTPVIFNKLKRYMTELTPQNADAIKASADDLLGRVLDQPDYYKFFANWITLQYEPGKTTVMDGAAIHVHMIQKYFTRERAFWADSMTVFGLQQRADQMAHSLVGQKGPDITVPGLDGSPKRLYDLKKPYIAVFMYNPECEHCIEQTPKLIQAHQGLKNELDVYAIALDTEADKWRNFVRQYGLSQFTNVYDPTNRSIFKTYYVDNTPELYLLGPDRTIVSKNLKVEQLAQAIKLAKSK